MKRELAFVSAFAILLLTFSGCPGSDSPFVGTWIVSIDGLDRGLEILPNGQATSFTVDTMLAGTFSWFVDGDQFIMNQDTGASRLIYSAQFGMNDDSMTGAFVVWAGQGFYQSNQWNAVRQ